MSKNLIVDIGKN